MILLYNGASIELRPKLLKNKNRKLFCHVYRKKTEYNIYIPPNFFLFIIRARQINSAYTHSHTHSHAYYANTRGER